MTPAPKTVRICHLYPRLLSVAGDRGNLLALTQRCTWRGIRFSVTEADVGEVPDFTQSDLILVHGGQDREMTAAARDLAAKASPLRDAIESDAAVLAVCAGYQLLGRYYAPPEGEPIPGLSVLDIATEGGPTRFIGHVAATCDLGSGEQHQLTGFENHSGRTYLGRGARPLGRVLAGAGNNGEDGTEGARYREVYATYLHGPVLPKNPWLADHLLSRALAHRYPDVDPLAPLTDQAEARASAAALRLARRPSGPAGGLRAAMSRLLRPAQAPAGAGVGTSAAANPGANAATNAMNATTADKETPWTSH
jgi:lipid II isoglutaminyl synthase (glutamine-hydrolysing)